MNMPVPSAPPQIRKFMFERSFDVESEAALAVPAPEPEATFSPAEVEDFRREERVKAFADGQQTVREDQKQAIESALAKIGASIDQLLEGAAANKLEQEDRMRRAVLAIARKILPEFSQKHGLAEVEALIGTIVREMSNEPRLVVRVNEAQFDSIDHAVKAITEKEAYAGKVVLLADAATAANDCRVEWADGGVQRNVEDVFSKLDKAIAPASGTPPAAPSEPLATAAPLGETS